MAILRRLNSNAVHLVLAICIGLATVGTVNAFAAEPIELDAATRTRCLEILRAGLRSDAFWPSMHAAEALTVGGYGDEVTEFLATSLDREQDDQHRCGIARELVRAGDRSKAAVLLEILAGDDPYGHVHAAESLFKVGELGDGVAMRNAFEQTENIRLRVMAAAALGRAGNKQALVVLREILRHDDPQYYHLAAWVLGRIGGPEDIPQLRKNVERASDDYIRAYQQHSLAALGDPQGLEALTRNLSSKDAGVRTYAAVFASDAGATHLKPQLIALLDDSEVDVRIRAAQSLLFMAKKPVQTSALDVFSEQSEATPANLALHQTLVEQAHAALDRRLAEFEKIESAEQREAWQQSRREFFIRQLGGFPERTPLNAQVVGELDGGDYRVEKILFESRPHHHVTAVLYLPKTQGPYPAVLIACGHSKTGKAAEYNQRIGILLAKNGLAALCYDPIGQGERSQILTAEGKPQYAASTVEHQLTGVGAILTGTNTAQYRIWDGMRSIDYLCSREDIAADRIGCTGCSGGGTLTSYLMALDDRIACAAPACYLTTFGHLIDSLGPQDAEQNIFGQIAFGMDHADYVLMRAPKPTLICATTGDYFDVRGTWETYRQAKRFYGQFGFPERVDLVESAGRHGVTTTSREALTRWMRRWLLDTDDAIVDPGFEVWSVADLRCTPDGEVLNLPNERTVFDLNVDRANQFKSARKEFAQKSADEAQATVRQVAGIRPLAEIPRPHVRYVGEVNRQGYRIKQLVFETVDGVELPALRFVPDSATGATYLYVNGAGKKTVSEEGGVLESIVRQGSSILAVDLSGCGELRAGKAGDQFGEWKDFYLAYLLGKSLVGRRAEEILQCGRWLAEAPPSETEATSSIASVRLMGVGEAGVAAMHAAACEPELFGSMTLRETIAAWAHVIRNAESPDQLTSAVHGALQYYDLPALRSLYGPWNITSDSVFRAEVDVEDADATDSGAPTDDVRTVLALPPGPDNPRNSEGDFIQLRDGRVLFVYTHFTGGAGDHAAAFLAGRYSSDGGKTWTDDDVTILPNEAGFNVMSVSLLRLADGRIAMFYLQKNSQADCRPVLRFSEDEAQTWSKPIEIVPEREIGYYVLNNDRVIQLHSGRLIAPLAQHFGEGQPKWTGHGRIVCYVSDDVGKTWSRGEFVEVDSPAGSSIAMQEPGAVELKDDRVLLFCRTTGGSQYTAHSQDGGQTWSPLRPSSIISPVSPATIERIPASGDLLMVWNNHANISPELKGKRTPLTAAISRDEGQTWQVVLTLADNPHGWYCYTAMDFVGQSVLLGHCAGDRRNNNGLAETHVTRFPVKALYRSALGGRE